VLTGSRDEAARADPSPSGSLLQRGLGLLRLAEQRGKDGGRPDGAILRQQGFGGLALAFGAESRGLHGWSRMLCVLGAGPWRAIATGLWPAARFGATWVKLHRPAERPINATTPWRHLDGARAGSDKRAMTSVTAIIIGIC